VRRNGGLVQRGCSWIIVIHVAVVGDNAMVSLVQLGGVWWLQWWCWVEARCGGHHGGLDERWS